MERFASNRKIKLIYSKFSMIVLYINSVKKWKFALRYCWIGLYYYQQCFSALISVLLHFKRYSSSRKIYEIEK